MHKITHNWSEQFAFGALSSHFPADIPALQELVRQTPKLRVAGARHSFNDIVDTPGAILSLRGLERRIRIDAAARTVTVDGGTTYAELCPVLDAAGWALFNLPSIPDFTIVGAVSTATHGSGDGNRNLASSVAALDIVTATGDIVQLRRGEPDFDGAVVSLGALGVVVSLTLDLVPRFDIRQSVYHKLPFDDVVGNFDAVMGSAYSLSLFTHWNGDLVDQAWLKQREGETAPPTLFGGQPAPGESSPVWGKDPAGTTAQQGVAGTWYDRLPHARIGAIPAIGYEYQAEYFVARADAPAAMRAIKAIEAALHPALVVSEIRTIKGDEFWLSTNHGADSVGFHFSLVRDWAVVRPALLALEAALAPFKPRPHWGKLYVLPPSAVMPLYPRLEAFRALAARHDPAGKFRNTYLDRFIFGA
ncbi:MAG: FAD-binding protein [Hyphomicrobiales bacterium]|nr:MAG: FAD-binding protein [Hyphomicrobiales bacterium]